MNERKDYTMANEDHPEHQHSTQALWNAIFSGTKIRHVGPTEDPRVFVLRSILWGRRESKVTDVATGEIYRFPWHELEFVDPVETNCSGFPPAPTF